MITLPIGYLIQMEISSTRKEENTIHTLKEMDISLLIQKWKKVIGRDIYYKRTTSYSIERDEGKQQYHLHMIIYYTNENNLKEVLGRFIGGDITERISGFDSYMGKYGTIWLEPIKNERNGYEYINKYEMSKTLV